MWLGTAPLAALHRQYKERNVRQLGGTRTSPSVSGSKKPKDEAEAAVARAPAAPTPKNLRRFLKHGIRNNNASLSVLIVADGSQIPACWLTHQSSYLLSSTSLSRKRSNTMHRPTNYACTVICLTERNMMRSPLFDEVGERNRRALLFQHCL